MVLQEVIPVNMPRYPTAMMTSSNGNISASLALCAPWIIGWANNGEAGDLRRHRAHFDVIVMVWAHLRPVAADWRIYGQVHHIDTQGFVIQNNTQNIVRIAHRTTKGRLDIVIVTVRHYGDVIMVVMAFQITSLTIVQPNVCSCGDQRIHQSSESLAFVRGFRTNGH